MRTSSPLRQSDRVVARRPLGPAVVAAAGLAIVFSLVALPGCDSKSPTAPILPEGEVIPVQLYVASTSGITEPERRVVRTDAAYDQLQLDIFGGPPTEPLPIVDFNRNMVLAVASGEQPLACYSIGITFAESDGTDLSVTVTETGPAVGCSCATVLSQPVEVVEVPRADDVSFSTEAGTACPN